MAAICKFSIIPQAELRDPHVLPPGELALNYAVLCTCQRWARLHVLLATLMKLVPTLQKSKLFYR